MKIKMQKLPVWEIGDPRGIDVVKHLRSLILEYGHVSLFDLYDMINIMKLGSFEYDVLYIDNKYGWTNPYDIRIKQVKGGYIIVCKKPVNLEEYYIGKSNKK